MIEGRRKVRRRVLRVMAMAVRQEYNGKGLAMQAMQRVQARIGEGMVKVGGGAMRTGRVQGQSAGGGYSLVAAGLKSCMQREGGRWAIQSVGMAWHWRELEVEIR